MAVCKICGWEDKAYPEDWNNWTCGKCHEDEVNNIVGSYSREERIIEQTKRLLYDNQTNPPKLLSLNDIDENDIIEKF